MLQDPQSKGCTELCANACAAGWACGRTLSNCVIASDQKLDQNMCRSNSQAGFQGTFEQRAKSLVALWTIENRCSSNEPKVCNKKQQS
ncbi:hypothetical protein PENARI_c036G05314 [Penicillium arizonense]|uniref:Uncharacterized protein n=1 Tax=Penicillium arizonense TaxID=1835702 RepID=A0A1F5L4H6_PENAI|nr:hypothetical protein PENARI_c036G05314 [Penicillium arizonense]OGE47811.1 hypothetical protein PENARI_c036G05314 [Penicillium arizonense]